MSQPKSYETLRLQYNIKDIIHHACEHEFTGNPYDHMNRYAEPFPIGVPAQGHLVVALHPRWCVTCTQQRKEAIEANHLAGYRRNLHDIFPPTIENTKQTAFETGVLRGRVELQDIDPTRLTELLAGFRADFEETENEEDALLRMLRDSSLNSSDQDAESVEAVMNLLAQFLKIDMAQANSLRHELFRQYEKGRYTGMMKQKEMEESAMTTHADNTQAKEAALVASLQALNIEERVPPSVPIFQMRPAAPRISAAGRPLYTDQNGHMWTLPLTDPESRPYHPFMDDPHHAMYSPFNRQR